MSVCYVNISSKFSSNSKAFASELLENLEEIFSPTCTVISLARSYHKKHIRVLTAAKELKKKYGTAFITICQTITL